MFRSKFVVSALTAVCLIAAHGLVPSSMYASPLNGANPTAIHAVKGAKTVKLSLCNSSAETLHLQVGETAMTIEPGKTVAVALEVGTKIVNVDATKSHTAGELIMQVSKDVAGATLRIG